MIIRALDGSGDWQFGKGGESLLKDNNAIALNIQTKLLCFFRDCWFDPNFGIDWLRLLGSKSTKEEILLNVRGIILQAYGVVRVNSIDVVLNGRSATLSYSIDTIFTQKVSQIVEVL